MRRGVLVMLTSLIIAHFFNFHKNLFVPNHPFLLNFHKILDASDADTLDYLINHSFFPPVSTRREVLVTLTTDMGKILSNLHKLRMGGEVDFVNSIQIAHVSDCVRIYSSFSLSLSLFLCVLYCCPSHFYAFTLLSHFIVYRAKRIYSPFPLQLALKHRQSKNHKPRIIAFIGSPIADSDKEVCVVLFVLLYLCMYVCVCVFYRFVFFFPLHPLNSTFHTRFFSWWTWARSWRKTELQ